MNLFPCKAAHRLFSVAALLLAFLLLPAVSPAAEGRQLWQSRDQFVTLVPQDAATSGSVPLNAHPVEIAPERLATQLASLEIRSADDDRPEQLFTNQSLETLVPQLVKGFRQATAGEDVTFAVIGLHKSLLGLAKSPRVTTGRAFFQGGRLNIIFGLVQKDVNEREDRRLAPFTPGSRLKVAAGEWALQPQPGQKGSALIRKDWVTFSDEWQPPAPEKNQPEKSTLPVKPTAPAERLLILKDLQEKGLISNDEYRSKRQEILNGL